MDNKDFFCGNSFETLSESELNDLNGGAATPALTTTSSVSCVLVSASISGVVTLTVLITGGKF